MQADVSEFEIELLQRDLHANGHASHRCRLGDRVALAVPGAAPDLVEEVAAPYAVERSVFTAGLPPLASRAAAGRGSVVPVGRGVRFGASEFVVAAGPCAVENQAQLRRIADAVGASGAVMLRGGAFKPRTSPYAFQGLGEPGLEMLAAESRRTGLPVVTEVVEPADVQMVAGYADMLQIGTRNAQNFALLREAGRSGLPVLLKRGFSSTVDEWLAAAEYVLREGNPNVVLCERGIRTFEPRSRFTLDLTAVALVKQLSHLPVVVDPSHSTGSPQLAVPMTLAAAAAGADGVLVDVHDDVASALCDGAQAMHPVQFSDLMTSLAALLPSVGRVLAHGVGAAPTAVAVGL